MFHREMATMFVDLWERASGEWDQQFAEQMFREAVANLFFQRFVIMALNDPCGYGLMPDHPSEKLHGKLTSISLVLGKLSNGMLFGEEQSYMIQFNQFILDNTPFIIEFLSVLANGTLLTKAKSEHARLPRNLRHDSFSVFDELLSNYRI